MRYKSLLEKFTAEFKKCKNSCVVQDINERITSCSYVSDSEDGELIGFNMLDLDLYCQGWLDRCIGSAIVWVNSDGAVIRVGNE